MFIPYFDVHEKNEKNSFSFFFSIHMQYLFLTYNTIELDNISLTSIYNCFALLVEGHNCILFGVLSDSVALNTGTMGSHRSVCRHYIGFLKEELVVYLVS